MSRFVTRTSPGVMLLRHNLTVPVRIFLLDDHEVVREGLRRLLEADPDLSVVGEAGTAAEALEAVAACKPNVAVLDVRLPDGDGIEVCRTIRSANPEVACLLLTSFADDEALAHAVLAGASGYVLKQIKGQDLLSSIRIVSSGQSLIDKGTASRVLTNMRRSQSTEEGRQRLSTRERQILDLVAEGKTNRQIGADLFLSEKTVKNYVSNLLGKLGMSRRSEAAAYAARIEGRRSRPDQPSSS